MTLIELDGYEIRNHLIDKKVFIPIKGSSNRKCPKIVIKFAQKWRKDAIGKGIDENTAREKIKIYGVKNNMVVWAARN